MQPINILIQDRKARTEGSPVLICNNEYSVAFTFDDEWSAAPVKTARFVYAKGGLVKHQDVVFAGNTVEMPKLSGVSDVRVGVYAGDLITTTPAWMPFKPSILCGSGTPDEPSEDVYSQIMALFNEKVLGPGVPVDQSYNAESENPQSGKAVAAALSALKEEVRQLIDDIEPAAASYGVMKPAAEDASIEATTEASVTKKPE